MKKRSVVLLVTVIIVVALAGVAGWLIVSGRVAIVWKKSSDRVVTVNSSCDNTIIKQYNAAFDAKNENDFAANLKKVADEVAAKNTTTNDPTCNFILYYNALYTGDKSSAQSYLDKVKSAGEEGRYINSGINNLMGIKQMQELIDLAGNNNPGDKTSGRG